MTALLSLDPLKVAAQIGHGAAVNVMLAFGEDTAAAEHWIGLGAMTGVDPFTAADQVAATFVKDDAAPKGERVFREAAEKRLHRRASDWGSGKLTLPQAIAFSVFGLAAHFAYRALAEDQAREKQAIATAAAMARPRKRVPVEDTIFEKLDGRSARDPAQVRALMMKGQGASAPSTASRYPSPASGGGSTEPAASAAKPKSTPKISIGERPIDMSKQRPAQHGGKREKRK